MAYIHWGLFELPGINLDEIEIPVREFPGGALPSRSDLAAMIGQVSSNVEKLATRTDAVIVQRILSEMKQFDFDVQEMNAFLSEVSPDLSLEGNGRGTHFYILPAVETLQQDIEIDAKEGKEISKLRRQLFGFTNTMTPDDSPAIQTAFRYWRPDDSPRELLEAKEFWTPEDLDKGDHRFTGSFDEYGQFRGKVCIYDQEPVDFVLPWSGSRGRPTSCGPFKVDIGYLQGLQRESRLPPDEWNALNRKLERIGGVYIYRDGIRILPYGDVDSDWLEIEKRRSLGAQYYFFSHRRIMGAIQVSREGNQELQEKAGREGFRENSAFRELKGILMIFLVQLAGEFFRAGAPQEELYIRQKEQLDRINRARQEAEKRSKAAQAELERTLDRAFARLNGGAPQEDVARLLSSAERSLTSKVKQGAKNLFGDNLILAEEVRIRHELESLRRSYRVDRPEGIGLPEDLGRDWLVYADELDRMEKEVFAPAEERIRGMVSDAACQAKIELARKERVKALLDATVSSSTALMEEAEKKTAGEMEEIRSKVRDLAVRLTQEVRATAARIEKELNELDLDALSSEETERKRSDWEREVVTIAQRNREVLDHVCAQLREVNWTEIDGHLIGTAEMRMAMEEELMALRDQVETYLELSQLGMAVEIISHEFNMTIRDIRARLQDMGSWAAANPSFQPLYRDLRTNFEHLDSYLNLFTPLYRRLYRQATDIEGSSIANFLRRLFEERLRKDGIKLVVSSAFKKKTIRGYPSTFYPVFINLVDNAIFWLQDRPQPREIHLDADNDGFIVRDTGPGISVRDMEAVFEMGFTRKPGGRGLGLYIARQVLRREGYELTLDHPVEKRGATFRITQVDKQDQDQDP